MRIANKYNLWVIEDCAQAHLANIDRRRVGTVTLVPFHFIQAKISGHSEMPGLSLQTTISWQIGAGYTLTTAVRAGMLSGVLITGWIHFKQRF